MNTINKLTEIFSKFPGIGPRQSKRFVYFLLTRDVKSLEELSRLILELKKEVGVCQLCMRFFANQSNSKICNVCGDKNRNDKMLMVVERDVDFENIEKSAIYDGKYFILGGRVPILEKKSKEKVRAQELVKTIDERIKNGKLEEIILAFSVSPDGENTERFIREQLLPIAEKNKIKISILGRGLSTGIELEYPDSETLKSAFKNRT